MIFKFVKGRQNTGYEKMKLFQFLNMDCYILRYNVGDYIPWHTDPVPNKRHYRLNITLKKAIQGGDLYIAEGIGRPSYRAGRIAFFRSDKQTHSVAEVKKGQRIVLTFGIAI